MCGGGATKIHSSPENTPSSPFLNVPDSLTVLNVIMPCIFFKSDILEGLISATCLYASYAFLPLEFLSDHPLPNVRL